MRKTRVLLSIRPEYVDAIRSGRKQYEYRKIWFYPFVQTIIIYETAPLKRVVGEVPIAERCLGSPEEVWNITGSRGGISEEDFFRYFAGRRCAYAYELGPFREYSRPYTLRELGIVRAPQSCIYLSGWDLPKNGSAWNDFRPNRL